MELLPNTNTAPIIDASQLARFLPNNWSLVSYCQAAEGTLLVLVRDTLHQYGFVGLNLFALGATLPSVIPLSDAHSSEILSLLKMLPIVQMAFGEIGVIEQAPESVIFENLSRQIFAVEGFRVRLRAKVSGVTRSIVSYEYAKSAKRIWNVSEWKERRFVGNFPELDVDVLNADGQSVHGRSLLANVRKTYGP